MLIYLATYLVKGFFHEKCGPIRFISHTTQVCFSIKVMPVSKNWFWNETLFKFFKLLIVRERQGGREREREREREKHRSVVPPVYALIGCFQFVPWPKIETANFAYRANALPNWATRPEPETIFWNPSFIYLFFIEFIGVALVNKII